MKMNVKRLTFVAGLLAASVGFTSAALAADGNSIGDLPGYGEASYYAADGEAADEAAYTDQATEQDFVETVDHQVATVGSGYYEPVSAGTMGGAYMDSSCGSSSCGCGSASMSCDSGCDSGCGLTGAGLCNPCSGSTWGTMEALIWFAEGRDVPVLVATSTFPSTPNLPLGVAPGNTQALFGPDYDSGVAPGFRLDVGSYVADNFGIGGRYWQLFDGEETSTYAGTGATGSDAIGLPFFNTDTGVESALLVSEADTFAGSVEVQSELEMWAAEGYARVRFSGGKRHSLDFIGGYTHMEIDDSLSINSIRTNIDNSQAGIGNPLGTIRSYSDQFSTENRFDGGQVGFETVLSRGKWMFRSLTKVHLGNMSQKAVVSGSATDTEPGFATVNTTGGAYSLANLGEGEQDEFSFIPEANVKLAYALKENISLSVGYSFLYIDNVATAASLVDRNFDGTLLNTNVGAGALSFVTDDLYVHGVDVGAVIEF